MKTNVLQEIRASLCECLEYVWVHSRRKKGDRSSTAKKYPSEILQKRMMENYSIEFSKETLLFNATKEGHVRY